VAVPPIGCFHDRPVAVVSQSKTNFCGQAKTYHSHFIFQIIAIVTAVAMRLALGAGRCPDGSGADRSVISSSRARSVFRKSKK